MKAYEVYDSDSCDNSSTIVFAENATKARIAAMGTDCCEDAEYINIRAIRIPEADNMYRGKTEVDWYNMEDRLPLVRDFGWQCFETSWECDGCECKPYCQHWEDDYAAKSEPEEFDEDAAYEERREREMGWID